MESGSLVKAFALLETLADRGGLAALAELAARVHITKPTAHRILQSLVSLGYVDHPRRSYYGLTPRLRWLTLGWDDRRLAIVADPILRRLHGQTGETVNLGVLRRQRIIYVTVLESNHPLRRVASAAESDPVFSTALGRAIGAHLPPPRLEQLLKTAPLERRTAKTITNPAELRMILRRIARDGYAVERDQTDLGVTCIAAAVRAHDEIIAAISLSVPSARVDAAAERRWIGKVRAAADALSGAIASAELIPA
jgi:DNA-binding IclR family transcriptional regulator